MKIYDLSDFSQTDLLPAGCTAALGNFDGVHIGHKALLAETVKNPLSAVFTFFEPAKPRQATLFLTDTSERLRLFAASGIRFAVLEDFKSIRDFTPEEFVHGYLHEKLKLSGAVCGENYHFGCGGRADAPMLFSLCEKEGISCTVVSPVMLDGCTVSSGAVRRMVLCGEMENARRFLGRPFSAELCALPADGAFYDCKLCFSPGRAFPGKGVYAVAVTAEGKDYPGAVYVDGDGCPGIGMKLFGFPALCEKKRFVCSSL